MKITKGVQKCPVRGAIYGTEKVGKTELASMLPRPLFIDVEGGSKQLDVARTEPANWSEFMGCLDFLNAKPKSENYDTIVIDTADWAERHCREFVDSTTSEKARSFGKDVILYEAEFNKSVQACEALVAKGYNVMWLAHSKVSKFSPPDQTDGFNRYEMKLTARNSDLLKEWVDMLLFCTTETSVVEGTDGKTKAVGGSRRIIHTARSAAFDAGNRYNLPEVLPMVRNQLAPELARIFTEQTRPTVRKPDVIPGLAGDDTVPPSEKVNTAAPSVPVAPVASVAAGHTSQQLDAMAEQSKHAQAIPGTFADPELVRMFGGQEEAAHAYLVRIKWLEAGSPLSALPPERVAAIKAKPGPFSVAAKLTLNKEVA